MSFKHCYILILIFFFKPTLKAQDDKFKALFMYNFTKYLEWPSNKQKGDFVIGIFGNSPIISELNIIAGKRKIGNRSIIVKKIVEPAELSSCCIVYLPENRSDKINQVYETCKNKGIVIISDKPGLAKSYSGLNYVKVNGKLNFEINRKHLEAEGIKINAALFSLGINVD